MTDVKNIQVILNVKTHVMKSMTQAMLNEGFDSLEDYLESLVLNNTSPNPKPKSNNQQPAKWETPTLQPSPLLREFLTVVVGRISRIPAIPLTLSDLIRTLNTTTLFRVNYTKGERVRLGIELCEFLRHGKQPDPRLNIQVIPSKSTYPSKYIFTSIGTHTLMESTEHSEQVSTSVFTGK